MAIDATSDVERSWPMKRRLLSLLRGDGRKHIVYAQGSLKPQTGLKGRPLSSAGGEGAGGLVQADLVGPRHLDRGGRFHVLNQIDVAFHHAGIEIVTDRGDQRVLTAFYSLWERHGLPSRRQLDNGGPFVSRAGLGEIVRVCLHQQITPGLIPPREPSQRHDRAFQRHRPAALLLPGARQWAAELEERTTAFERFHNSQHRYSPTGRRTPEQSAQAKPRTPMPAEEIPTGRPEHGHIEFIRFIRSDLRLAS